MHAVSARVPGAMRNLPLYEGVPVPWFTTWHEHRPDYSMGMSEEKFSRGLVYRVCIICGSNHRAPLAFLGDVVMGIEQIARVPGCHIDCGQWAAKYAPGLPRRRDEPKPDPAAARLRLASSAGGVRLVWICRGFEEKHVDNETRLRLWAPEVVEWYVGGRSANRSEVLDELERRRGELERRALTWTGGLAELRRRRARLERWLPGN